MNRVDAYRAAKGAVARTLRRHWNHPVVGAAERLATRYLRITANRNHNLENNGEAYVLRRLPAGFAGLAVDVGANRGEWTAALRTAQPRAVIHCFEPFPDSVDALRERYGEDPAVHIHPVALGSTPGTGRLWLTEHHSTHSLVRPPEGGETMAVDVFAGDEWLASAGVSHIDIVKVDTEGHDLEVLRGFSGALAAGAISVIQFEYNEWNATSHALLSDFYALLEPHGYLIGKVHPNGVDFRPYDLTMENWVGPACVAVRSELGTVIDRLGVR